MVSEEDADLLESVLHRQAFDDRMCHDYECCGSKTFCFYLTGYELDQIQKGLPQIWPYEEML
jgi:hypothetical protein